MMVMDTQPILFVQGAGDMQLPDGSGRLAAYLASELGDRYRVIAPAMPEADNPRYQAWSDRVDQELGAIEEDVIIVGHSFGGSVVLKCLAKGSHERVQALFLISTPDWGPDGWAYEEFAVPDDGCRHRKSSCTTAARTPRYRSRTSPTTKSVYRRRRSERSPGQSTPSSKGFRRSPRTFGACLNNATLLLRPTAAPHSFWWAGKAGSAKNVRRSPTTMSGTSSAA